MAAVQRRLLYVVRSAAIRFTGAFMVAIAATSIGIASSHAAPLAAAMSGLASLQPQIGIAHLNLGHTPFNWTRRAHHAELVRRHRRARIGRMARISQAHTEFAHMTRRGQEFCLATAVYFEARDEPIKGQRAVAAVILARTHTLGRPRTVCGVVFEGSWRKTGCQFSFACDGRPDTPHWPERWIRAQRSAAYVWQHQRYTRSIVRGATFYHTKFVHPRWDKHMIRVARIGLHVFYRPRHGRSL